MKNINLLSVSGKMNSGKDTVGLIIQYLTDKNVDNESFHYWYGSNLYSVYQASKNNNWQIKKFADKLKDIVCLLIGCTREQLEDPDFKNKELGEEWWFNHILPEYGFGAKLINWDKDLKPQKMTPRLLMQLLGTDCGRDILHPNIWVNSLFSDYNYKAKKEGFQRSVKDKDGIPISFEYEVEYPNWIITDMRFPNELEAVKSRGGISILVQRPCKECGITTSHVHNCSKKNEVLHESEIALDNAEFDYYISNDGTIEELIEKVRLILIDLKIISDAKENN